MDPIAIELNLNPELKAYVNNLFFLIAILICANIIYLLVDLFDLIQRKINNRDYTNVLLKLIK